MNTAQRIVSHRLLELLSNLDTKRKELERVGIQLELMTDLYEQVGNSLFEVNGIDPAKANVLWMSLEDFISGQIQSYELFSLLKGNWAVVTLCDNISSQ
ncbi:hypothetical protein [Paenibacillus taichungensis]|uniref:hypothetical protein n=1 Tax=Paenibacillus taichungensis TaxID=484184 RepID=UPI0038D24496